MDSRSREVDENQRLLGMVPLLHLPRTPPGPWRGSAGRLEGMPRYVRSLLAWSKTHQGKKIVRYTAGSVITTGVSFSGHRDSLRPPDHPRGHLVDARGQRHRDPAVVWLNRSGLGANADASACRKEIVPYWSHVFACIAFSQIGRVLGARHRSTRTHWSHLADTAGRRHQPGVFRDLLRS